jgi:integrative and conjugative element protein (TIGR02256 family)
MKINRVLLTENCLSNINKIVDNHIIKTEVGGSLVGYQQSDNLIVTHASDAGKNAKMSYNSIEIDGEYTTKYCNRLNKLSNYRLYFLGDWHTHLSDNLNPSSSDLNAMRLLSKFVPEEYRDVLITVIFNHFDTKNFKVYCLSSDIALQQVDFSVISNPRWIEDFI